MLSGVHSILLAYSAGALYKSVEQISISTLPSVLGSITSLCDRDAPVQLLHIKVLRFFRTAIGDTSAR